MGSGALSKHSAKPRVGLIIGINSKRARVLPSIKRKPLSPTARRAGWVGCSIALDRILFEAWLNIEICKEIRNRVMVEEAWPQFIGRSEHVIWGEHPIVRALFSSYCHVVNSQKLFQIGNSRCYKFLK